MHSTTVSPINIEIYFNEADSNDETRKLISEFAPIVEQELHCFYQKFNYKIRVHQEKRNENTPIPIETLIVIFDLDNPVARYLQASEISSSEISDLGREVNNMIYSAFHRFIKKDMPSIY